MRVEVCPYRRPFRQPLRTAHGPWAVREGIILRFADEQGQVTFGEIAPIPWFGTETLEQAREFCDRFPRQFSPEQIDDIPDSLPACQFGFSAVRPHPPNSFSKTGERDLSMQNFGADPKDVCALLPTGEAALAGWQRLWQAGHRTLKWKIGVAAVEVELAIFQQLVEQVPPDLRLRLDANGGLTPETAAAWLAACDRAPITIEFLEQPLPPATILDWLPQIRGQFRTAIALDESVATLPQLQQVYQQVGDRGVYVVKPAIAGSSQRLADFCLQHRLDVVFSSALETPIGRHQALRLAQRLWDHGLAKRAVGFGVGHWFADDWSQLSEAALWARL
jgi:O-succinylbenzoate synthase